MPSKPETAPYDLIASSDQSIANTLQYTRSLSHTIFWAPSTGSALYTNITAAAQAATEVCAPATLKSGDKVDKISMACTADWRNGVKERVGQADDKSVLAAAAALEVMQGVLWGMPKDEQPKETNMPEYPNNTPKPTTLQSAAKPEEPKQTQKPQDPEQTPKPADPTPTAKPEDPKQTTNAEPQPSQTTTQEQPQSSQPSGTGSVSASPTTSGDAQPSVAGGSASRAKFGWMVVVSAFFCAALMV
jgi:outer membrane biosynthesis protein TonB